MNKNNPGCVVCGGDLVLMGQLGRLKWFRCRACGMEQSRKVKAWPPKRKIKQPWQKNSLPNGAPGAHEDRAAALEKRGRWLEAAKEWEMAAGASIGHGRRERYYKRAELCRKMSPLLQNPRGRRRRTGPSAGGLSEAEARKLRQKFDAEKITRGDVCELCGAPSWGEVWKAPGRSRKLCIVHAQSAKKNPTYQYPIRLLQNRKGRRNPIEPVGGGHMITGKAVQLYRLLSLKHALKLELATGMKMSRGISPFAIVKKELGFTGNKQKIYDQLVKYIEQVGPGLAQNPGREFAGVKYWRILRWNDMFGRMDFIAKVRATYREIRKHFPGANVRRLDMMVGEVRVMKKSQARVPAKVRK